MEHYDHRVAGMSGERNQRAIAPWGKSAIAPVLYVAVLLLVLLLGSTTYTPIETVKSMTQDAQTLRSGDDKENFLEVTYKFAHQFATKTIYWRQKPASPRRHNLVFDEKDLRLIQTQILTRHGIRYPTSDNIQISNAFLDKLTPFSRILPSWLQNYSLPYNISIQGKLAASGRREMEEFAERSIRSMGHLSPFVYAKTQFQLAHTVRTRTRDSAIAFASKFFSNPDAVEFIQYPADKDELLRFFDECPRYQRTVKHNMSSLHEMHTYEQSHAVMDNIKVLTQALGLANQPITITTQDVIAVYTACAFDFALYKLTENWCTLLTRPYVQSMDYLDDLKSYYWLGGGYKINYEMAAVLLQNIVAHMKKRIAGTSELVGNFYFAHAETVLPLITLLGYGDRRPLRANATDEQIHGRLFRSSVLAPFATNVEFRLYESNVDGNRHHFVQILVNEQEAAIPGCEQVFCELSVLEKIWNYYLEDYNFTHECQ